MVSVCWVLHSHKIIVLSGKGVGMDPERGSNLPYHSDVQLARPLVFHCFVFPKTSPSMGPCTAHFHVPALKYWLKGGQGSPQLSEEKMATGSERRDPPRTYKDTTKILCRCSCENVSNVSRTQHLEVQIIMDA